MRQAVILAVAAAEFLPTDIVPSRRMEDQKVSKMWCSGRMEQSERCDMEACPHQYSCDPIDGVWSDWLDWGSCSCAGVKQRDRPIAVHAACGGVQVTGSEIEAAFCERLCNKQPTDCSMEDWSDWSVCDKDCGGGQQFKKRAFIHKATLCGETCGAEEETSLMETQSCNSLACTEDIDCSATDWSDWTDCSRTCGGGDMSRGRKLLNEAEGDGKGCTNSLKETKGCADSCCDDYQPQDCKWEEWTEWSDCTVSCDGGHRKRQKDVQSRARHGGAECVAEGETTSVLELEACGTETCNPIIPVDGEWQDWADWSTCSTTCGTGFKHRLREVDHFSSNRGDSVSGFSQDYAACNDGSCDTDPVDCIMREWSEWGACSATMKGTKVRSKAVFRYSANGGKGCEGAVQEVADCNIFDTTDDRVRGPVKDCLFSEWKEWDTCSKSCGGGYQSSTREISQLPHHGGKTCNDPIERVQPCHMEMCNNDCDKDRDCTWGEWVDWSTCSKTCGGGEMTRFRTVAESAMNFGKACNSQDSQEVTSCSTGPCGTIHYCEWSDWSAFSPCSISCGSGTKMRSRELTDTETKTDPPLDTAIYYQSMQGMNAGLGVSTLAMCASVGVGLAIVAARRR